MNNSSIKLLKIVFPSVIVDIITDYNMSPIPILDIQKLYTTWMRYSYSLIIGNKTRDSHYGLFYKFSNMLILTEYSNGLCDIYGRSIYSFYKDVKGRWIKCSYCNDWYHCIDYIPCTTCYEITSEKWK